MVTESERQAIVDEEDMRLLPVFYWVLGALDGFVSLYGLIYVAYGVFMMLLPTLSKGSKSPPPQAFFAFMGWFMIAMGVAFILAFGTCAVLKIMNGFWIHGRRRRTASLVVAGLTTLAFPFGTVIGVFTYLVLLRPSVVEFYAGDDPSRDQRSGPDSRRAHGEVPPTDQAPQPDAPEAGAP